MNFHINSIFCIGWKFDSSALEIYFKWTFEGKWDEIDGKGFDRMIVIFAFWWIQMIAFGRYKNETATSGNEISRLTKYVAHLGLFACFCLPQIPSGNWLLLCSFFASSVVSMPHWWTKASQKSAATIHFRAFQIVSELWAHFFSCLRIADRFLLRDLHGDCPLGLINSLLIWMHTRKHRRSLTLVSFSGAPISTAEEVWTSCGTGLYCR